MEAHYWPTRAHLEELRSQGQVPYSSAVTYCAATAGALLGLALAISQNGASLVTIIKKVLRTGASTSDVSDCTHLLLSFVYFPLLACVACAVLVGLLQTRFLFYFDKALPDFARLAWKRHRIGKYAFKVLLASMISGITVATALWLLVPVLLTSFNFSPQLVGNVSSKVWWGAMLTFGGAVVFLMVAGWLVSWFQFRNNHRMTRQEYEAEARE